MFPQEINKNLSTKKSEKNEKSLYFREKNMSRIVKKITQ